MTMWTAQYLLVALLAAATLATPQLAIDFLAARRDRPPPVGTEAQVMGERGIQQSVLRSLLELVCPD